jgi:dCMP deaminase
MEGITWSQLHITNAVLVSMKSKDPRTKVGAVIVDQNNHPVSTGFNGIPRGVEDTHERLHDRDVKKFFIEHAERNAIYAAKENLEGCSIYITFPPCADCARAIIQSGIKRVVTIKKTAQHPSMVHYSEHLSNSMLMFKEAGVEYVEWDGVVPNLQMFMGGNVIDLNKDEHD